MRLQFSDLPRRTFLVGRSVHTRAIPSTVLGSSRQVLFTGKDVIAGQEVFLKNGLMEYGSIFGHGAYLGTETRGTTCRVSV